MKKNAWILIPLIIVVIGCFAVIQFFKPNQDNQSFGAQSDSESVMNNADGQSQDNYANSDKSKGTNTPNNAINEDESFVEDNETDFNAMVYGDESGKSVANVSNQSANEQATQGEGDSQYFNTKSDMTVKPINPETDPANQLVNSKTVKPLLPEPEAGNKPDFVTDSK